MAARLVDEGVEMGGDLLDPTIRGLLDQGSDNGKCAGG